MIAKQVHSGAVCSRSETKVGRQSLRLRSTGSMAGTGMVATELAPRWGDLCIVSCCTRNALFCLSINREEV